MQPLKQTICYKTVKIILKHKWIWLILYNFEINLRTLIISILLEFIARRHDSVRFFRRSLSCLHWENFVLKSCIVAIQFRQPNSLDIGRKIGRVVMFLYRTMMPGPPARLSNHTNCGVRAMNLSCSYDEFANKWWWNSRWVMSICHHQHIQSTISYYDLQTTDWPDLTEHSFRVENNSPLSIIFCLNSTSSVVKI